VPLSVRSLAFRRLVASREPAKAGTTNGFLNLQSLNSTALGTPRVKFAAMPTRLVARLAVSVAQPLAHRIEPLAEAAGWSIGHRRQAARTHHHHAKAHSATT